MQKAKLLSLMLPVVLVCGAQAQTGTQTTAEAANSSSTSLSAEPVSGLAEHGTISAAVKPPAARPYSFALITANYAGMQSTNEGQGTVTALNQIRAEYKLDDTQKLRLNQVFTNEYGPNAKSENASKIGDLYLQYSKGKIAEFADGAELKGSVRAYAPISAGTREKNQVTSVRVETAVAKKINKTFEVGAHLVPWVSYQTTPSYKNAAGSRKANSPFNLAYYVDGTVNFSEQVNFVQEAGLMRYWYSGDASNGLSEQQKEFLYLDSALNYSINKTFEVGIGLSSYLGRDLMNQSNSFSMYRSDETDYYFTGSASF